MQKHLKLLKRLEGYDQRGKINKYNYREMTRKFGRCLIGYQADQKVDRREKEVL